MSNTQQKLPMKVKLAYAFGHLGRQMIILLNMYFILYFYTDVVGISAAAAGTVLLIGRIWDAVNDPIMGVICDKNVSGEGKCRFFIKRFSVPAALAIVLSYFCPEINSAAKVVWVTVTYLLQDTIGTMVYIPQNTLRVRMTDNRLERVKLGQLMSVGSLIVNVVIPSVTLPLVRAVGGENMRIGFLGAAGFFSLVYLISMIVLYRGTKGYDGSGEAEQEAVPKEKTPTAMELIKCGLTNGYVLSTATAYFCYLLVASIMSSSLVYYFTYNLKNTGMMSLYSAGASIGSIIIVFTMSIMHKKLGNAKSAFLCCALSVLGCLVRWITKDANALVFVLTMVVLGFGSQGIGAFTQQCQTDACTYGRLKKGVDNPAVTLTLFGIFQKAGEALGGTIAAWLLATVPYVPNAEEQAQSVQNLFFAENILIPMGLAGAAGVLFLMVNVFEGKLKKMMAAKAGAQN